MCNLQCRRELELLVSETQAVVLLNASTQPKILEQVKKDTAFQARRQQSSCRALLAWVTNSSAPANEDTIGIPTGAYGEEEVPSRHSDFGINRGKQRLPLRLLGCLCLQR